MRVLVLSLVLILVGCKDINDTPGQNPQPKAAAFLRQYFPGQQFAIDCPRNAGSSERYTWVPCTAVRQDPRLVVSLVCYSGEDSQACYMAGSVQ